MDDSRVGSVMSEEVQRATGPSGRTFAIDTDLLSVLIADSSAPARRALSIMLKRLSPGITVHDAGSGPSAQAILQEHKLDLAFIDRRLPEFDGREMLRLRGAKSPHSLLILMSDLLTPRWAAVATSINAYEVMLKPFNETHVESILNAHQCVTRTKRVLIVDRSRTARKIVTRMVDQSPFIFSIDETDSGRHAVMRVGSTPYDLALIDSAVTDGDGFETACGIMEVSPLTKVVMMGSADKRRLAVQCGVSFFLEKPFRNSDLEYALHSVFGLWRPYLLNAQSSAPAAGPAAVVPAPAEAPALARRA